MTDRPQEADEPTDAALLARIAAGDAAALAALYRRRKADVYRFAYALCRSSAVAQDATHDVFLRLLERAGGFDPAKGSARAWLYGCARHVLLGRLRRERQSAAEPPEESVECSAADDLLRVQRTQRLHAAIVRLPLEFREVIVLCELEELSYAECAAVLRCPVGTVRSRLHRARELLGARLQAAEQAPAVPSPQNGATASPPMSGFAATEACP
jgi:RNA polymerase sigma-70 factor (ECF subfamily)